MAKLNFDARTVAPSEAFDPIPAGWYNAKIVDSEMKPTKTGNGAYLALTLQILDGQYANRKVFDRLNLHNQNPVASEIAYRTLSAICHATGVIQLEDSQQLQGPPLQVKVSYRPAGPDNDGVQRDASNEVKGYKPCEGGAGASPTMAPPARPPAPQATTPAGWGGNTGNGSAPSGAPVTQQPTSGLASSAVPAQQGASTNAVGPAAAAGDAPPWAQRR